VLAGFSQGGSIALLSGLSYPQRLGGIVGLSCYMLLRQKFQAMIEEDGGGANKETKIFMGHGEADQLVLLKYGKLTADTLKDWGYQVEFKTYS
jgi:predicted esterase